MKQSIVLILIVVLVGVVNLNISFTQATLESQNTIENLSLMPRNHNVMAYDEESDRIVLFGGYEPSERIVYTETWSYDVNNNVWISMTPDSSPKGGVAPAMIYDSKIDKMILFGGLTEVNGQPVEYGETWSYDLNTNTWKNLHPSYSPEPRIAHRMVYDSELDLIILQGGHRPSTGTIFNDIWTYNYSANNWEQKSVTNKPSKLDYGLFVYSSVLDKTVYFGQTGETWSYNANNNNYTQLHPTASPSGRGGSAVTYNTNTNKIILFGGSSNDFNSGLKDQWNYEYNTNNWTSINGSNAPSERFFSSMTFDSESNRAILFGGGNSLADVPFNDTWSFNPVTNEWSQLTPTITYTNQTNTSNSVISSKSVNSSPSFLWYGLMVLVLFRLVSKKKPT